jgi:NTP pyrophosphatase (non-canonical NTP hydrolase)
MKELTDKIIKFRDERKWEQFQSTKDLLIGLSIEVAELQEIFLWNKENDSVNVEEVKHELADIFIFLVYISEKYKIDLEKAVEEKIEIHKLHYPVKKSKGKNTKYNKLNDDKND